LHNWVVETDELLGIAFASGKHLGVTFLVGYFVIINDVSHVNVSPVLSKKFQREPECSLLIIFFESSLFNETWSPLVAVSIPWSSVVVS